MPETSPSAADRALTSSTQPQLDNTRSEASNPPLPSPLHLQEQPQQHPHIAEDTARLIVALPPIPTVKQPTQQPQPRLTSSINRIKAKPSFCFNT